MPDPAGPRSGTSGWSGSAAGPAGPELDLALRARHLWDDIAQRSPAVGLRPVGSVTVAGTDSELALMVEAAAQPDASSRMFELLDATGIRDVNPAIKGDIAGGLWCRADAVVEPGSVLGALRATLEATGRYHWVPGRQAVDVQTPTSASGGPTVIDHRGDRYPASVVVLCVGRPPRPGSGAGSAPPSPPRPCDGAGCR